MHPFDAEQLARKFTEDDRHILREMAEVHDPDTPPNLNPAYVERSHNLMEEREAQIFSKGRAFATRTDRGWSPPTTEDVEAVTAAAKQVGQAGG